MAFEDEDRPVRASGLCTFRAALGRVTLKFSDILLTCAPSFSSLSFPDASFSVVSNTSLLELYLPFLEGRLSDEVSLVGISYLAENSPPGSPLYPQLCPEAA